jgi:hypothetical protein
LNILQIVPRLPPSHCGVADYSLDIARELRRNHDIHTRFVVVEPSWSHKVEVEGFKITVLPRRRADALRAAIDESGHDVIVIQYSGYGFHRRGAPLWLLSGLTRVKQPIVTMFHELFASGPITSSAFWLSPLMKLVARRLANRSSHILTNREGSATWLARNATVMPVFSSLGECLSPIPIEQRENWLALFPYQSGNNPRYWTELTRLTESLRPDRLVLLGRHSQQVHECVSGTLVDDRGVLPAEEVSRVLQQCRFGYLSYYPAYLGKSAILAAFAAHALALVFSPSQSRLSDGLEFGRHFLDSDSQKFMDLSHQESCARQLAEWYSKHTLARTTDVYARILRELKC